MAVVNQPPERNTAVRTASGNTFPQEQRLTGPAGDSLPAITVTNTADSGPGSLRQAILDLCPAGGIDFDLPLPAVITLTSGELMITAHY